MQRFCWKIPASIGLIVFSQTASATLNNRVAMIAGNSNYQNMSQPGDAESDARPIAAVLIAGVLRNAGPRLNDSDATSGLDQPSIGPLAQAVAPAPSATTPPLDSNAPHAQPPAAASPPNPTEKAAGVRAGPSATGCGLKYLAAELAGKLKGRKWKEFREEECGAIATQAVFPSAIAPKYAGESPDKARTLTCADQFKANKATNANDGMKWIEKGGGYYSECVSRLKG